MDIYDRINVLLKERKTTRVKLGKETGISYHTLTAMFQRRSKNVDVETLKKIAEYLGTTLEFLVSGNEEMKYLAGDKSDVSHTNKIKIFFKGAPSREYELSDEKLTALQALLETMSEKE